MNKRIVFRRALSIVTVVKKMAQQHQTVHWNNFTLPELQEILQHCGALERIGIAQDEQMMVSIENDIASREKKNKRRSLNHELKNR